MTTCNDTLNWSDITPICELITELDFITDFELINNFGGFHRTLQQVWLSNRGRLLLRTPGPVPFGTCICFYVETILSWTSHAYGPFEFRTSLGISILHLTTFFDSFRKSRLSAPKICSCNFDSKLISNHHWYIGFQVVNESIFNASDLINSRYWEFEALFTRYVLTYMFQSRWQNIPCKLGKHTTYMLTDGIELVSIRSVWHICLRGI